jgi:hypothetical protein
MTVHPDFHAKASATQCDICGCIPCASRMFCKTCRAVDRKLAARRQSTRADHQQRPPTPQSTIEAIMVAVRARGIGALKEPANLDRLRQCDAKAKAEIDRRIDALFQQGILR